MYGRYNMFDLMEPGSDEKLRSILKKLDIEYTPQMHNDMNGKPSKENVLSNILNVLSTSNKIIEFKRLLENSFVTDQAVIKAQNIEVNFEKIRISNFISKKIINKLEEEVKSIFLEIEKIKRAQEEISELNRKDIQEKDERIKQAVAADIASAQQRLDELTSRMNKEKIAQEAMKKIEELNKQIQDIDIRLSDLKINKKNKLQEFFNESAIEYRNFKYEGNDVFQGLSNEELVRLAEEREKIRNRNSKPIRTIDQERKDIKKQINHHEHVIANRKHELLGEDIKPLKNGSTSTFMPARQLDRSWAKDPIILASQEEIQKLRSRDEQLVEKRKVLVEQVSKKNESATVQALTELGHTELANKFKDNPDMNKAFDDYNAEKDAHIALFREEYRDDKKELVNQKKECNKLKENLEEFDFDMDELVNMDVSQSSKSMKI